MGSFAMAFGALNFCDCCFMRIHFHIRLQLLLVAMLLPGQTMCYGVDAVAEKQAADHFETKIRPLLAAKCIKCHGAKKQEGELRLDSREALFTGGESGPAVVAGKLDESLFIEAIRYDSLEMPPNEPLSEAEIRLLEDWVSAGVYWPEHLQEIRETSGTITDEDRQWWAFQPLKMPEVPQLAEDAWSQNEIDRFVYQKMGEKEIQPAPQASRVKLLRRLYFDLLGVPPTPEEIAGFLKDTSPQAWEHWVDRLLADERYGEHWARFWLDVVRYAESDGWNKDAFRPHIWRYRDYVVNAFNNDKPYPEFVRQQLAGDEIEVDNPENLIATGFLRHGIYEYNQRDARSHWNDIMNEMTSVTGDVFLGVSMACARCHDHKFDPLFQTDFYTLRAFFEPIAWRDDLYGMTSAELAKHQQQQARWEEATKQVRAEIEALIKPHREKVWAGIVEKFPVDVQACYLKEAAERTTLEQQMAYLVTRQLTEEGADPLTKLSKEEKRQYQSLTEELKAYNHLKPKLLPSIMAATDFPGTISPTVHPDDPSTISFQPRFLTVLSKTDSGEQPSITSSKQSSGRRTALAEWIGRPDNPLSTRVIVNRIWQQHFGQGIVSTANDFGHLGQPPSHPELLDWLTISFVEQGWRIKWLHKQILMSATLATILRQSSG